MNNSTVNFSERQEAITFPVPLPQDCGDRLSDLTADYLSFANAIFQEAAEGSGDAEYQSCIAMANQAMARRPDSNGVQAFFERFKFLCREARRQGAERRNRTTGKSAL